MDQLHIRNVADEAEIELTFFDVDGKVRGSRERGAEKSPAARSTRNIHGINVYHRYSTHHVPSLPSSLSPSLAFLFFHNNSCVNFVVHGLRQQERHYGDLGPRWWGVVAAVEEKEGRVARSKERRM